MPRSRQPKAPEVIQVISDTGDIQELNTPEQIFLEHLRDSEDKILDSIKKGLTGKHEPARVTNAAKVLEAIDDPNTPDRLRPKLDALRPLVMKAVMEVSQKGKVASARAQANALWLRAMRSIGKLNWPPDEYDPLWKVRFDECIKICNERGAV